MTPFDEVIDLALVSVTDYSLVKLYNKSEDDFKNYCDGLLIKAIPNFFRCRKDLAYDKETRTFNADLDDLEISILADFWNIEWMKRKVNDSSQFQAKLQNSGNFKNHSEAQNLKEKTSWFDRMREQVDQKITEYQLQHIEDISI